MQLLVRLCLARTESSGLTFNNSTASYVPYPLNYIEEFTLACYADSAVTSTATNIYITRKGHQVSLYVQQVISAGSNLSSYIGFTSTIPTRFLPIDSGHVLTGFCYVINAGTGAMGFSSFNTSTGNLLIYVANSSFQATLFTASTSNTGYNSFTINYYT